MNDSNNDFTALDREHCWHPYATMPAEGPILPVVSAAGVRLRLADGTELIDAMASWWCAIHGYNHPVLNRAVTEQVGRMAHVMFGGLTHEPAARLAAKLIDIAPAGMETVFFADSGSVSVEVAIKMAIQYQRARGQPQRQKLLALRGAYHGDTLGAMAACDPVTGMHAAFRDVVAVHYFADRPAVRFGAEWNERDIGSFAALLERHSADIAAVILEPIVQGAGGMWFYHPDYLRRARQLCSEYGTLLIADEIATGFGRTGKLFACEHAGVTPDILCLGKALTGGTMTLAATLATREVADTVSQDGPLMHGPTFMANPLACSVALASIEQLQDSGWQSKVAAIEARLARELEPCGKLSGVADVRVLGAIGVVEMNEPVNMRTMPGEFVKRGVWVRPFGRLVYVMPPYTISAEDLARVTAAIREVIAL